MPSRQFGGDELHDPLLKQAETILAQRISRTLLLDRDLFGEPGWDILLCAYIACRKGKACTFEDVYARIDLNHSIVVRWVNFLAERNMLVLQGTIFSITEETEQKITLMFQSQINEVRKAFSLDHGAGKGGSQRKM